MRIAKLSFCLAGLLTSSAAFADAPGWKISESSGQVTIVSTGLSKAASRGGVVSIGQIVATGANGRAVLVRGEEYMIVSPNTRIRVADPAKSGGLTQIIEIFGNTVFKIKKMTTPHFAVQTPYLAAVVKGTTFSVTVSATGASVQVVEGRVEVLTRDGGASYLVLPGDIGSVAASAPMQLNVEGRESKSIVSKGPSADAPVVIPEPEEPKAVATPEAPAPVAAAETSAAPAPTAASIDTPPAPAPVAAVALADTFISAPISEGQVKLETLSGGLIKGDTAIIAVAAIKISEPTAAPTSIALPPVVAETVENTTPPTPTPTQPTATQAPPTNGSTAVTAIPEIVENTTPPTPAPTDTAATGNTGGGSGTGGVVVDPVIITTGTGGVIVDPNSGGNSGPGNTGGGTNTGGVVVDPIIITTGIGGPIVDPNSGGNSGPGGGNGNGNSSGNGNSGGGGNNSGGGNGGGNGNSGGGSIDNNALVEAPAILIAP